MPLISRWLLYRIGEEYGISATLDANQFLKTERRGAHTNFSTKSMREDGGYEKIIEACEKLVSGFLNTSQLMVTASSHVSPDVTRPAYDEFKYGTVTEHVNPNPAR